MMTPAQQLQESILSLETALLEAHPTMPQLLRKIHKQLKDDPTIVTLLSEQEVGIIVSGLKKQTVTEIATSTAKSKTKSLKSLSVGDL